MPDLEIELMDRNVLIPYANNAKEHPEVQIKQIAASIQEFGFNDPIAIDDNNVIIEGHGRLLAAELLKLEQVPVIRLTHMTEAQKKLYILAHNKINQNSGFDLDIVKTEFEFLLHENPSLEVSITGFDPSEFNLEPPTVLPTHTEDTENTEDNLDRVTSQLAEATVTEIGDTWSIGPHRLICGDCRDTETRDSLLPDLDKYSIVTDPPYGVPIMTNFNMGPRGEAQVDGKNFKPVEGNDQEFDPSFLFGMSEDIVLWGANHFAHRLPNNGKWLIWDKREDKIPQRTQADCELAWYSKYGAARIFRHYWDGMIKASERGQSRVHPTQKPIALFEWVYNSLELGPNIVDFFLGSGASMVAAQKTNRVCYGMEISPEYCDVVVLRMANDFPDLVIKKNGKKVSVDQLFSKKSADSDKQ